MLRIGVVGAGIHSSSSHGPALATYRAAHPEDISLAAICDINLKKAERYARRFGFARAYDDLDSMLEAERLDGIVAVSPIESICRTAGDLLARGLPVMLEKPPGRSSEETEQLLKIAEGNKTPHMISFNRRFIPAVVKAREWLAGVGKGHCPRLVTGRMSRRKRLEPTFVVDTGIHAIDLVLSFISGPAQVRTRGTAAGDAGGQSYAATIGCQDGGLADIAITPNAGVDDETYHMIGQGYRIRVDAMNCSVDVTDGDRVLLSWRPDENAPAAFVGGALGETEAFVQCLKCRGPCSPDLRDGLAAMLIAEAMQNELL